MQRSEADEHMLVGQSSTRHSTLHLDSFQSEQRKGPNSVFLDYLAHLCTPEPLLAPGDLAESARRSFDT